MPGTATAARRSLILSPPGPVVTSVRAPRTANHHPSYSTHGLGISGLACGRRVHRRVQFGAGEYDRRGEVEVDEQPHGRPEAPVGHAVVGEVAS